MTRNGNFTYDANGNTLTDAQGRQYTWDFENRLTQVVNPGVGTTAFKYDAFGRRIQKSGPNGTTNYLYERDNPSRSWMSLETFSPDTRGERQSTNHWHSYVPEYSVTTKLTDWIPLLR